MSAPIGIDTVRLARCCSGVASEQEGRACYSEITAHVAALETALKDYATHQSWRCEYRSRYETCRCGLDEEMQRLGLPVVSVEDPEATLKAALSSGAATTGGNE